MRTDCSSKCVTHMDCHEPPRQIMRLLSVCSSLIGRSLGLIYIFKCLLPKVVEAVPKKSRRQGKKHYPSSYADKEDKPGVHMTIAKLCNHLQATEQQLDFETIDDWNGMELSSMDYE